MQIGSVLKDRFELTELLSEGSIGNVYIALDKRQEESGVEDPYVALKVLGTSISDNNSLANNLCRVSVRQRRLHHPNILTFFEFDSDQGRHYVTLPLLAGVPLSVHRQDKTMTAQEVWSVVNSCHDALTFAHGQGIVHGDVSPETIFYTEDRVAKLFDFTVAEVFREYTGPSQSPYASQHVKAGGVPRPEDDLIALAAVAHDLIQGFE